MLIQSFIRKSSGKFLRSLHMLPAYVVLLDSELLYIYFVSIQESLAQAVAEEMQKVYQTELGPEPVPITVPGKVIDDADVSSFCFMWL